MRVIGLTGGIASGKSTASRIFADVGARIIDADLLAREVVEPGTPALAEIAKRWPDCVVDGVLDRKKLGARIFGDDAERRALNAIVHPRVAEAALARIDQLREAGEKVAIYEAALIVENRLEAGMNGLIVVSAPEDVQLARLRERDQLSADEARARLAAQLPLREKLAHATWVVDNGGALAQTREQVERIWREITEGAT